MKTRLPNYFLIFTLLLHTNLFAKIKTQNSNHDSPKNNSGQRIINSIQVTDNLRIDGNLNEEAWQNIKFQENFIQREPNLGQPATEKTQVAILQSLKKLYIGIWCFDSEADKIIARDMRRDSELEDDDYFQIVIDSYHDLRNGYYFKTNPNGAKRDATFGDEGKNFNPDWDGIWDCAAQITEDGWFAEIAIPWKTLRFANEDTLTWGINFARGIRRKNEQVYWQMVSRDVGYMGIFRLSQAGDLTGLTEMRAGGNWEVEPYILAGSEKDAETDFRFNSVNDFGIDAKIGITPNLAVNLTWNTDFAQVESDQERVNLTRFSLYFPEKREFFLDGAEMFNFGGATSGRRRGGASNNIRLFYSRRIGIVEGHEQPITGGAKVLGKMGKYQIGMLHMQTEGVNFYDEDDEEEKNYRITNFTVLRFRREILKRSNIGVMFLNKNEIQSRHYNRSGGFDVNFPITDRILISGALAGTFGPDEEDDGELINMQENNFAGFASFSYDSDLWEFQLSHLGIQENFNAELGYVRRTNIKSTRGSIEYNPRPKRWQSVRQLSFRFRPSYMTDFNNRILESQINSSFSISYQNSARIYGGINRETEFLDDDWEVRPGINIPKRKYRGWNSFLWVRSNESANLSAGFFMNYGDYYTGKGLRFGPELVINNFERTKIEFDFSFNHVNLPQGKFDTHTLGCRLYYYFSTKLYLKAYLQYNDDRKENDGNILTLANILLRWIYRPGSDLYLVYNESREMGASKSEITNRTLMLKATYFWRK
ncbi:carbohydrate binding family 9 domain-containing protein [candidate division KSB1 bacterium]|nr:carbohydrate binding family 9 domain-containing protein [candidate division KSB1 bacterium]MBL7094330.1 carbohydrate binding family 9 domain-containing protein [candidate division KSB1 bacterium]